MILLKRFFLWRARLLITVVERIKPIYARWFQKSKKPWAVTLPELRSYPSGTLGRELAVFLDENGFRLEPLYESHDVYHLLLNYPTTVPGEGAMQFCLLGNGKRSTAVYITVIFSCLLLPEYMPLFVRSWRKGRQLRPIGEWQFEHLLREPLPDLLRLLHNRPPATCGYIF